MATKEAKRVVRIYNRVARALIEFETLWQQAWLQSLEAARAGLQATLIVAHPDTGRFMFCPQYCSGILLRNEQAHHLNQGVEDAKKVSSACAGRTSFKSS